MRDGWHDGIPGNAGDCRKLVTVEKDGMIWVAIRAWNGTEWLNNGARSRERVLAWRDLPSPAYSDGMMQPMSADLTSDWH